MAVAPCKSAGVKELARLHICNESHFWRRWNHEAEYIKAYNAAVEKYQGEAAELVREIAISGLADTTLNVANVARSDSRNNMRAAEIQYALCGIDTGRAARFNLSQRFSQNVNTTERELREKPRDELEKLFEQELKQLNRFKNRMAVGSKSESGPGNN